MSWSKTQLKWLAQISHGGKQEYLGVSATEEEAKPLCKWNQTGEKALLMHRHQFSPVMETAVGWGRFWCQTCWGEIPVSMRLQLVAAGASTMSFR